MYYRPFSRRRFEWTLHPVREGFERFVDLASGQYRADGILSPICRIAGSGESSARLGSDPFVRCSRQVCRIGVYVIKVRPRGNESVQQMLKRFKRLCQREGLIRDMKRHSYYEKPSERKRRQSRKAARPKVERPVGGRSKSR